MRRSIATALAVVALGGLILIRLETYATVSGVIVNWFYTVLTGLLIFVVFNQVRAASQSTQHSLEHNADQQRLWATLQVCDRYDIDPEISDSVRYLRKYHWHQGSALLPPGVQPAPPNIRRPAIRTELPLHPVGSFLTSDQRYTLAAGKLLNYFDSIAIGLEQNFYKEHVCREHIGGIFCSWMHTLRRHDPERFDAQMAENFERLPKLYRRWGGTQI